MPALRVCCRLSVQAEVSLDFIIDGESEIVLTVDK